MPLNLYEIMIAWRFLIKGRLQTVFIIFGIAMGVAVQFFLSSLIGGLQISIIERTVGAAPHIVISPEDSRPTAIASDSNIGSDRIKDSRRSVAIERPELFSWQYYVNELRGDERIKFVSPVIDGNGFIRQAGSVLPVQVKGLLPPDGSRIYKIEKKIVAGNSLVSGETALLAKPLADKLALQPGDKFILENDGGLGISLVVGGIFDLGAAAGRSLVMLPLERVRSLYGFDGVSTIEVQVFDVFDAEAVARYWAPAFSRVKLESWQETNREMLAALSTQQSSSYTIQFFVLFSISLGIASVLAIAAVQKSRQLGILKAIGTTDGSSAKIFIVQGVILGTAGSVLGLGIGLGLSLLFVKAMGSALNFELEFSTANIVTPVLLAVIASTIAAAIPARRAARLSPIEVIRNG